MATLAFAVAEVDLEAEIGTGRGGRGASLTASRRPEVTRKEPDQRDREETSDQDDGGAVQERRHGQRSCDVMANAAPSSADSSAAHRLGFEDAAKGPSGAHLRHDMQPALRHDDQP
jgi:hypothetical protein